MNVIVVHKFAKVPSGKRICVVDTTSNSSTAWERDLSPFHLGPCRLYGPYSCLKMENGWQYSKVYECHTANGSPTQGYWRWAKQGWRNPRAVRYPMGNGARPLYSLWHGERLDYIEARKRIYGPLYVRAVRKTDGWRRLKALAERHKTIYLRDWDGWETDLPLKKVLNNPHKKMGHAFWLKAMLIDDQIMGYID